MVSASYWYELSTATRTLEVGKLLNYVSLGVMFADNLAFASFDWALIKGLVSGDRVRRWPQFPYLFVKLLWYPYITTIIIVFLTPTEVNCQALMDANECIMGIITVCCSSLLAARTLCVWQGTRRTVIAVALSILGIAHLATWMAGVSDVHAIWTAATAQPWSTGGCFFVSVETRYFVKYIVTIAFDFTVLILTIVGVRRMQSSRIGEILIDHGIIYFILTAAVNIVVTILTILQLSPMMSTIAATPASCVSIMAATRLYVSLNEEARAGNAGAITMNQLTSSGTISKRFSSLFRLGGAGAGAGSGSKRTSALLNRNSYAGSTPSKATGSYVGDSQDLEEGTAARVALNGILIEKSLEVHHDDIPGTPMTKSDSKDHSFA